MDSGAGASANIIEFLFKSKCAGMAHVNPQDRPGEAVCSQSVRRSRYHQRERMNDSLPVQEVLCFSWSQARRLWAKCIQTPLGKHFFLLLSSTIGGTSPGGADAPITVIKAETVTPEGTQNVTEARGRRENFVRLYTSRIRAKIFTVTGTGSTVPVNYRNPYGRNRNGTSKLALAKHSPFAVLGLLWGNHNLSVEHFDMALDIAGSSRDEVVTCLFLIGTSAVIHPSFLPSLGDRKDGEDEDDARKQNTRVARKIKRKGAPSGNDNLTFAEIMGHVWSNSSFETIHPNNIRKPKEMKSLSRMSRNRVDDCGGKINTGLIRAPSSLSQKNN
ncbi:hypothetical protein C8R45DRAFT_1124455 [Mycena sanguinolenta]|nr:hypothetical protein C8R45DRAFT_1124455 [Mycena sanguinolenta]